jgi:prepilin-type N-terminal cleavage/methylation domain-containing protein
MRIKGFTLIELLIVVAIIAILAAIAVPNFLEAQTRSKVSRVKSDMRTLDTALSAYFTDNNKFPLDVHGRNGGNSITELKYYMVYHVLTPVTTPVAYMTSVAFLDPFSPGTDPNGPIAPGTFWSKIYSFQYYETSNQICWGKLPSNPADVRTPGAILVSMGPDRALSQGEWSFIPSANPVNVFGKAYIYDPTNGTVSDGDIVRGVGAMFGAPNK